MHTGLIPSIESWLWCFLEWAGLTEFVFLNLPANHNCGKWPLPRPVRRVPLVLPASLRWLSYSWMCPVPDCHCSHLDRLFQCMQCSVVVNVDSAVDQFLRDDSEIQTFFCRVNLNWLHHWILLRSRPGSSYALARPSTLHPLSETSLCPTFKHIPECQWLDNNRAWLVSVSTRSLYTWGQLRARNATNRLNISLICLHA